MLKIQFLLMTSREIPQNYFCDWKIHFKDFTKIILTLGIFMATKYPSFIKCPIIIHRSHWLRFTLQALNKDPFLDWSIDFSFFVFWCWESNPGLMHAKHHHWLQPQPTWISHQPLKQAPLSSPLERWDNWNREVKEVAQGYSTNKGLDKQNQRPCPGC